jgi:hypothetical protein
LTISFINYFPLRAYSKLATGFKTKERPRGRGREDIKDDLQQCRLTMFDTTIQVAKNLQTTSTPDREGADTPTTSSTIMKE